MIHERTGAAGVLVGFVVAHRSFIIVSHDSNVARDTIATLIFVKNCSDSRNYAAWCDTVNPQNAAKSYCLYIIIICM